MVSPKTQSLKDYETNYFNEEMIIIISKEHENLYKIGFSNFKQNYFFGSGVKTFYDECKKILDQKIIIENKRNHLLTHPHNTYIQILSDTSFFSALIFLYAFVYILYQNIKIFL